MQSKTNKKEHIQSKTNKEGLIQSKTNKEELIQGKTNKEELIQSNTLIIVMTISASCENQSVHRGACSAWCRLCSNSINKTVTCKTVMKQILFKLMLDNIAVYV